MIIPYASKFYAFEPRRSDLIKNPEDTVDLDLASLGKRCERGIPGK